MISSIAQKAAKFFLPNASILERKVVTGLARDIRTAGEFLTGLPPEGEIPGDVIPVNPELFGPDPFGRRTRFEIDVIDPLTGEVVKVISEFGTVPTMAELIADALEGGLIIFQYEKFASRAQQPSDIRVLQVVSAQRRF